MTGVYKDRCHGDDLGMPVNERFLMQWYSGQGQLLKKATRRTGQRIDGKYGLKMVTNAKQGDQIPPTPENILNMKRGCGLNKWGSKRLPSLWNYASNRQVFNLPYVQNQRAFLLSGKDGSRGKLIIPKRP